MVCPLFPIVYDTNHNILAKKQSDVVTVAGGSAIPQKGTSYDWQYAYEGAQPHAPTHIGNRSFSYDLNGNQTGWQSDVNGTRRFIQWDEENRIAEIDDNGERNRYVYDAKGERAIKETKQGETVYVNQYYVVRNRSVVSKHLYAGSGRIVTHLVMGTVPGGHKTPGNEGRGAPGNGHGSDKTPTTPETGNGNSGNVVKGNNGQDKDQGDNGLHLGQLKNGKENPGQGRERRSDTANAHAQDVVKNPTLTGAQPGQGSDNRSEQATAVARNVRTSPLVITEGEASVELGGDTSGGESIEGVTGTTSTSTVNGQSEFIWYYHPDHLGSTGFVTDQNGELYEHVEYFPFGETWVQEHSSTQRTPYLYTGKELDEETGLYYYGARYYDPRTSVWASADPILGKYFPGGNSSNDRNLPGLGGIFNSANLGLYGHTHQNPVKYIDPDGNVVTIRITDTPTGSWSYVNTRKGAEMRADARSGNNVNMRIGVPLYRVTVENESGTTHEFSVTRHAFRDANGDGGIVNRTFTGSGTYRGKVREDGSMGARVELQNKATGSPTIYDADGRPRGNVQIHIGAGCSEACQLIPGGSGARDSVMDKIKKMQSEDRDGGFSGAIVVKVSPAPTPEVRVPEYP